MDLMDSAVAIAGVSCAIGPSCRRALAWSLADVPWWAFGGLLLVAVVGYVVLMRLRRSAVRSPDDDPVTVNLEQLEELRRQGLMTDREYRRGRRAVLAGLMPTDVPPPEEDEDENDPAAADAADGPDQAGRGDGGDDPPAADDGDDPGRPAG